MILVALLLTAWQPLDRPDALNESYTKCLFATARAAQSLGQSLDEFRGTLSQSCIAEEHEIRSAMISILIGRGLSRAAAERDIDQTLRGGREAVLRAYSYGRLQ